MSSECHSMSSECHSISSECHSMSSECHSMSSECHSFSWYLESQFTVCHRTSLHVSDCHDIEYKKSCYFLHRLYGPFHCGGHLLPVVHPSWLCGNSLQVPFLWEDTGKEGKTCPCSVSADCSVLVPHWADSHTALVWLLHCTLPKLDLSAK